MNYANINRFSHHLYNTTVKCTVSVETSRDVERNEIFLFLFYFFYFFNIFSLVHRGFQPSAIHFSSPIYFYCALASVTGFSK
jgi:hypothetical protein